VGFKIVVVGASLGGMSALETLLKGLPGNFPLPIAIVQHRSAESGQMLSMSLRKQSALRISEPQDKEAILPGQVYIAPADYHLLVDEGSFSLSTEGPVSYARPSIDVLFESASDAYGERVIGVILTGSNQDGAYGAARIKERGGYLIVQQPDTSESAVMPKATLTSAVVDRILPLREIAPCLVRLIGGT
jgi:two-component system chemotaxis response regulator CheB